MPQDRFLKKRPWPKMEVGDSVFIQAEEGQTLFNLKRKVSPSAK